MYQDYILVLLVVQAYGQISVHLVDTTLTAPEGQQFPIRVQITGTVTAVVNVVVQVKSPLDTGGDFVGSSRVGSFYPGGPNIVAVTFTVNDDSIPEVAEHFIFELSAMTNVVTVGTPSIATITIPANDDAYGVFKFVDSSHTLVTEATIPTSVSILVGRDKGTFEDVRVNFTVTSTQDDAVPGTDISPVHGSVVFQAGVTSNYLQLQIEADNIPENNEEFLVTLTDATNARVDDTGMVLIIQGNDAPVRFQQAEYRYDEGPGKKSVSIPVLRGIDQDGQSRIGSVDGIASVDFSIVSNTASDGLDFTGPNNRQLVFTAGQTQGFITLDILDDINAEVEESFQLLLTNPVGDVVPGTPFKTTIFINGNDNPNGVISLKPGDDGVSLPLIKINEDGIVTGHFIVLRSPKSFGTATVEWEIYRNDSSSGAVSIDILNTKGSVVFQAGQSSSRINITIIEDSVSESTERFVLKLKPDTVTDGAKVEGVTEGIIVIEDSDNYYGSIQFGDDTEQQIIVISNPRHVQITVRRTGYNQGSVVVNMTVVYTGPGSTEGVIENSEWQMTLPTGVGSKVLQVPINSSAFLQVGGKFIATLTDVGLTSEPSLGAFNSPVLGTRTTVEVPVTLQQANGEIGFQNTYTVTVSEPETSPYSVNLQLFREGTSGQAVISWVLSGSGDNGGYVTQEDTGPTSGTVVMEAEKSEAYIAILINPDDVPELEEELTVTLTSVSPSDMQRLKYGSTKVKILVLENDNPGGTFQFSSEMKDLYQVEEGSSSIDILVDRQGGSLLTQLIQYTVHPNGAAEFYGYTNVLKFNPGIMRMSATLLPIADGIPEKVERFTLTLSSYGNITADIGSRSQITMDILENDDPYGLIIFEDDPPIVYMAESTLSKVESTFISIKRNQGTFGSVTVTWDVTPSDQPDLTPMSGMVTFGEGQSQGVTQIRTVADDIPEATENFTIQLRNPTGGAHLGSRQTFTVIINKNDNPLYFEEPVYYVSEASVLTVKVKREGDTSQQEAFKYQTLDGTAVVGDYNKLTNQDATFQIGQNEVTFQVEINEDVKPEGNETFYVEIFQIIGDLVLTKGKTCSIVILANDNAYGRFKFLSPYIVEAEEGSPVTMKIFRDSGTFGEVDVSWEIIDGRTGKMPPDGSEFEKSNGTVLFPEDSDQQTLTVFPRSDDAPEKDRVYSVRLHAVTVIVGMQDAGLASLYSADTQVTLTIKESDDPYGRYAFTFNSREVTIAEDYYPGLENTTVAKLNVERRQGGFGNVQVVWETYSDQVGTTMPTVYDLMLLADPTSDVSKSPNKRRPHTGTDAMYFTGAVNSYLIISSDHQPPADSLKNGYTISTWLQPFADLNSYIIAKTTNDGSRFFYTLKVTTGNSGAIFLFGFTATGNSNNQQISVTSTKNIKDGNWHHVLLTIDNGAVMFYLDGGHIGTKILSSQPMINLAGKLYIGAIAPGNERFIGYLQDVRIYTRKLTEIEIGEIYNLPAQNDISPVSGYLSYHEALREQTIVVTATQDSEEEKNEVFTVMLLSANNGGTLSETDSTARVTIQKSDNANGVFGIRTCTPSQASEISVVTCVIERQRGDSGSVNVTWSVYQSLKTGDVEATDDFLSNRGMLVFIAGERLKTFTLTVKDDDIPEVDEIFKVKLLKVASGDGLEGSTDTSGASIDPSKSQSVVTILKNDFSNGVLQFSNRTTPPSTGDGILPVATEEPTVKVTEESGRISLLVVRAQGTAGFVTVEWRTLDGTAKSSGIASLDYKAEAGRLEFSDGQLYSFITIDIIDNPTPENEKTFYVQLVNPTGGATVSIASKVTVVIGASDGAFGTFQFSDASLNVVTEEIGDSGYIPVLLQVNRLQGNIGTASVTWQLLGNPENDIVETNGVLIFDHEQNNRSIEVKVRADTIPELDESYQIKLTFVQPGELGVDDKLVATVTILANDDPYGQFVFLSNLRPVQVEEAYKNITLTVNRLKGTYGTVDIYYRTLGPTETHPFVPSTVRRAGDTDYRATTGSVRFQPTETTKSFTVTVMDDVEPENDESVFVTLVNATLVTAAQTRTITNSPSIGPNAESLAQVMIVSNDIANGALELSPISVTILENSSLTGVKLTRRGGTFGQVTVRFRVVNGSALEHSDFEVLSTMAVLQDGVISTDLPIRIIDDIQPEIMETFFIELQNEITGGGVLGTNTYAVVNIQASDDPVGAFEFDVDGLSVEEPENGQTLTTNIIVVRTGGTLGVVSLTWTASLNGGSAASDVSPISGSVHFVSNDVQQTITVQILPDDIPEGQEDIKFTLNTASDGGTLGLRRVFTLSILPNDNPHGIVQLAHNLYTVQEKDGDSVQTLALTRLGGQFGQLRIAYSTKQIDIVTEAVQDGNSILSYFTSLDGSRGSTGTNVNVTGETNPSDACGKVCLRTITCVAFEVYAAEKKCIWYNTGLTQPLTPIAGYKYYIKITSKVNDLYSKHATEGQDYNIVTNGYTYISEGSSTGSVSVTIKGDNEPEIDEKFVVQLTSVEVISGGASAKHPPKFGSITMATVVIDKNDNAYGIFDLISDNPAAIEDGHKIGVEERHKFAVDLVIERKGGSLGDVSIEWHIDIAASTATYGVDYQGDGATLQFKSGDTRKLITVTVLDDNLPELNKTVMVKLRNPQGGAEVSQDAMVTIVILENDYVAGVIGFGTTSLIGKEGIDLTLSVIRGTSDYGTIMVDWEIRGTNDLDPAKGFSTINGSLAFLPGDKSKQITLTVLEDTTPEVNEEYHVHLLNIKTVGIGASGAAIIDPQLQMATITIDSSNYPHGILQFSPTSLDIVREEQDVTINLQIERKYGNIGAVRVSYEIKEGSVKPLSDDLQGATANADFTAQQGYVDIPNSKSYSAIQVTVKEDSLPEVDEAFIVVLTGVTLLDNSGGSTMPPQLGATNDIKSQITISANDGTKGVIMFASDSHSVAVDEISKNITLTVLRNQGTFGEVTVFCYAQSITDGATQGQDYQFDPMELVFKKGEERKYIFLQIFNDDIPEPDEIFEVILANPRNGAILGTPSRANVTILANDDSSGSFSFETDTAVTIEETDGTKKGVALLKIVRGPGIYGVVNLPYKVTPEVQSNNNDLSPMQSLLVFQDRQDSAILELEAVDDNEPEQTERFTVKLLQPNNGGLLGQTIEKVVIINPNDSPNGLMNIYARATSNRTIAVDENIGLIYFDIQRTQGTDGRITVDVATQPGTAITNTDLSLVTLTPVQVIPSIQVVNWYSYTANGLVYVVMLTNFRVGELTSAIGSDGSAETVNVDRLFQSTLFKWQGELIPLQTIETDIASAAASFTIGNTTYLAISNTGNTRRYQSNSRIYKVNTDGTLLVLQDLPTSGARDVKSITIGTDYFLVFANSKDNNGNTLVSVNIYKWDQSIGMFTFAPWQSLSNQGAEGVAIFQIEGVTYMAVANNYNSDLNTYLVDSVIYKLSADNKLSEHQRIRTEGAVDVKHILIRSLNLLVFANNRGDSINSPQKSGVYRWDSTTQMFFKHSELNTYRVEGISAFIGSDDIAYLIVANSIGTSDIFYWNIQEQKFMSVWTGSPSAVMYPLLIPQSTGALTLVTVGGIGSTENATLYQFSKIKDSDFSPRTITMTFEPGQKSLHTSVLIVQDDQPEETETFYVTLTNPKGGAEIGPQNMITVNILSNDNAHGIIEFSPDFLEVLVIEEDNRDNTVLIKVIRKQGFFGRVVVKWSATGDQNGLSDLTPLEGTIEFASKQSEATITLTILNDNIAELPEVTYIHLIEIVQSGSTDPDKGAVIGTNKVCKLIVQANDSPYGVLLWERESIVLQEPDNTDFTQEIYITRQQGKMGQLQIAFSTRLATGYPVDRRAISGEDYVARQSTVVMQENVTRVPVQLVIKQDDIPEADETFLVNITGVTVMGVTPPAGAMPSIKVPGNIITITIKENDNARGSVEFDVITNIEGRIDMYEEFGKNTTVSLKVKRSIGVLGTISVTWQAEPREASFLDFGPPSGSITLMDGHESGEIIITIIDDLEAEEMETFDVKLLNVVGGSALGPHTKVRIAILKNDSPNGLFRFVQNQVTVRESTSSSDPQGEVTLDIERVQGKEGVVNVQWRLNAEALYDFMDPISGTVMFAQGESKKSITLRTKMDSILEGEEQFKVSLISADNSADISHTQGDATIVLLPDPGSAGTIRILPEYKTVYIGEPGESSSTYNGQVELVLTRGSGIYGDIAVTWAITPRDTNAFMQIEGTVQFVDLQPTAKLTLQAKDDTVAELRREYTLTINSATGGATVSNDPGSATSTVVFVASDYPHGLFEFSLPEVISITEDTAEVTIPVIRQYGTNNVVMVTFTTSPGTAEELKDFIPRADTLDFQNGQNRRDVKITIEQDDIPEGPEVFYLNLTSARRIIPSGNNYTIVNGLQLDMAPAIGSVGVKTILIQKNDNAEGTVEFGASKYIVVEESGVAKIPVIRKGGNYGSVTIKFTVTEVNASAGVDYVVPDKNEVVIANGQRETTIDIVLRDDTQMEYAEHFTITIDSLLGGAKLGSVTMTTVVIAKSDYPNGMFGFKTPLEIIRENPTRQEQTTLTIERTGGVQGQQTVNWRLMGPNNPQRVLLETNDIYYISNNQEKTSGSLVWADGELGAKTVTLNIKPYSSWEIQKAFIIEIVTITGYPANVGNGEIGPTTGKASITIKKHGHPSGIIQFTSVALTERTVEEPNGINPLKLEFPIQRKDATGLIGSIQVFWEITGPFDDTMDFHPRNGSVNVADGQRDASFNIQILPDTLPELTEMYKVILTSVTGGAEIDTSNNEAVFHIRYNDHPHGLIGLVQSQQAVIVDPSDLVRSVLLNFTRHGGTFGSVIVTFSLSYDIPQSGVVLTNNGGPVTFSKGQTSVLVKIPIEGSGFLAIDTTFTATLITVAYLGEGVTEPPKLQPGETEAKIPVPTEAANSVIGFKDLLVAVDEETNTATVTLKRTGTYGTVNIPWQIGYPSGQSPTTGSLGNISPQTGTVIIPHGVETKDYSITVTAIPDRVEYFVLHLPYIPSTTVPGGARLDPSQTLVKIEPHGIIRFAANSTNPLVSEMDEKAYLLVQRVFGSEGKIEVTYRSQGVSADKGIDYITTETNAIIMEPGQVSALITIQVLQDNHPEEEETFHINFTHVEKYPTELVPKISPRVSSLHSGSLVRIDESNDPYGILSIEPLAVSVEEEPQKVNLNIQRTGGIYGTISVVVRTVGGGEPWTSQIVAISSDTNDTITQILGNRNSDNIATGEDYEILDTKVTFLQGETTKQVSVSILTDDTAEPDETVIVYLTQPTGGARIALGTPDGGKKGFSIITILQNDEANGIIGFSESSKFVTVNEDTSPTFTLQLSRMNAKFGEVLVSWQAKVSQTSTHFEDTILADQLVKTGGSVKCPPHQSFCSFDVSLKDDQIPEEEQNFIIQLVSAEPQAELNYHSTVANITVQSSDYYRGLLQFTEDSRIVVMKKDAASVRLNVERVKGRNFDVDVSYQTDQMSNRITLHDIDIFPAYESEDFSQAIGVLSFGKNTQDIKHIDILLTPRRTLSPSYPKQLYVLLKSPTNGASVNPDLTFSRATILIVEESNIQIWTSIIDQDKGSLQNNTDIIKTLATLDLVAKNDLDDTELSLIEKILENILDEGQKRQLPEEILNQIMDILCDMLNPGRRDATRGRSSLGLLVEKLAYCKLTGKPCSFPDHPRMSSYQYCLYAKISAARWPLQNILSYHYQAQRDDSFTVPEEIVDAPSPHVNNCIDFHVIEYSSELWFMSSDQQQLLSNKVINFGMKNRPSTYTDKPAVYRIHTPDRRIVTSQAQCVFYDYASKDWVSPTGWCQVTNDLATAMDDFVDCSCKHLTNYAVKATAIDPGIVGYSEWFYVACFICMIGMALTILVHHICSMLHAMFSANLLMHMCFACFATQLCYIVSAYGSPDEILVYNKFENNYRCIVMGLFLHYFFLTQFTWILAQSINYWKILVMNDEHTDRKYVLFFLIGWGSPAVVLAIYYTVTYNLYKYVYDLPVDHIYGDVNNNGQICFITNPYAGLGGVIIPVILLLIAVGIIFMKAFQVTPQWQAYDDIYRGRYNINEIRTLLSFWGVITLTWFWGGLHLAYGQLWMMILFIVFNILQGVMVIVLYTILRNPCIQKCFGPQKSNYPITTGTDGLTLPSHHTNVLDIGSLKGSRASVLNESWEKDSLHSKSTMKVKRTLPINRNIYVTPPVFIPSTTDDNQDDDLDELLFALKNDSFVPSETSSIASGKTSDISSKIDKYEMRRISIADTHL